MATPICFMKKENNQNCGGTLYRCEKCGAVGCNKEGCRNQNWINNSRCARCGGMSKRMAT